MDRKRQKLSPRKAKKMSNPKIKSTASNLQLFSDKEIAISLEKLIDSVVMEVTAHRSAPQPQQVIAKLKQVKEEQARSELESKSDKYKEQCTELQSENEKLQSENEKLQSENEKLQNENEKLKNKNKKLQSKNEKLQSENEKLQSETEKLQKYLQDLESANINVEEKSQINLYNTDLNSQITKIMNNTYLQTPGMIPPPGITRDYPYGPTSKPTSNPLYSSSVDFSPNISTSPYPSTAFTSGNPSNRSFSAPSSLYLLAPNNPYPVSTSPYLAISNNPYPASSSYPASYTSLYPASTSPCLASSNKYSSASGSPYPVSSNSHYLTSSNSPNPAPTSAYPCSSNRYYPATNSSYSGPTSMNQPPGASSYPSMGSRDYDSKFGPSVNESNDDAVGINSLPDEVIEEVFGYLTQNQLGQIARVCRRWNVLTKSPVLWRKVNVKIFSCDTEKNAVTKSFITELPSCVTFIRLDFSGREDLDFEELCVKLHQNCPDVEELILAHSGTLNILPEVINFCTQFLQCVKKLVFHNFYFSNHSRTVELNDNSKIEVLDLYDCALSHISKTKFSKLFYLKELRLADTNVGDMFIDDASVFNQLYVLDLRWTRITASTFLAIQRHGHNLKELYLCDTILKDHDLNFSNSTFPYLKTICIYNTFVTCEGLVSLIQSCPSLQNVYVDEDVAESFAAHTFVLANKCKSGIVKAIDGEHDHKVDYSHN